MHDLVIRHGTIIDGSGAPAFDADIAIDNGKISRIGGQIGAGREELEARDKLVAPGWVDIHSHYDGQVMWDPELSPSGFNGASTVLMGHCGVGFAPMRAGDRELAVNVMEGLEDIPGATLRAGVGWNWETFPEYLDVLDKLPRMLDFGTQVPHAALRPYVMGERGSKKVAATPDDIQRMSTIVEEAIRAGAFGFSTSRTRVHNTADGHHIPGSFADRAELFGIAAAIGRGGGGVFQMVSDFDDAPQEFMWMEQLSRECGIPVHYLLSQFDRPKFTELLSLTERVNANGAEVFGLAGTRAIGMLITLDSEVHPFWMHPSYLEIAKRPLAERVRIMRDPQFRQKILSETTSSEHGFWKKKMSQFDQMFRLGIRPNYEPTPDQTIAALAASSGSSPWAIAYDMLLDNDGAEVIYFPLYSYAEHNLDGTREMLEHPNVLASLADGGAHLGFISDTSMPTFLLTHWARDRSRGQRIPLEKAVMLQTSRTAASYGLHDRGRLAVGYKADINVIDFDQLRIEAPYWAHDLPANGRRLMQRPRGYDATMVSGVVTSRDGESTGALPGRLVRGPQRAPK